MTKPKYVGTYPTNADQEWLTDRMADIAGLMYVCMKGCTDENELLMLRSVSQVLTRYIACLSSEGTALWKEQILVIGPQLREEGR